MSRLTANSPAHGPYQVNSTVRKVALARDGEADIEEVLARRESDGHWVALQCPLTPAGGQALRQQWQAQRRIAPNLDAAPELFRRLDETSGADAFPGFIACEVVATPSVQERSAAGEAFAPEQARCILDRVLDGLQRCRAENIQPPDLHLPSVYCVGSRVVLDGVGRDSWENAWRKLAEMAQALLPSAQGSIARLLESPRTADSVDEFAWLREQLAVQFGQPVLAPAAAKSVRCPKCGVEYLSSVFICQPCGIDVRTGAPAAPRPAPAAATPAESGRMGWLWLGGALAFFGVLASVLGWPWVAGAIGAGFAVALLALMLSVALGH